MLEINLLKPMFSAKEMRRIKKLANEKIAKERKELSVCKNCNDLFNNVYTQTRGGDYWKVNLPFGEDYYSGDNQKVDTKRQKKLCPDCIGQMYERRKINNPNVDSDPSSYKSYGEMIAEGFKMIKEEGDDIATPLLNDQWREFIIKIRSRSVPGDYLQRRQTPQAF